MSLPPVRALLGSIDDLPDDLDFEEEDGCIYLRAPIGLSEDDRWLTLIDVGLTPRLDSTPLPDLRSFDYHEFGYEITILDQLGKVPIRSTMNRDIAKVWLPPNCSGLVVDVVSHCCRRLLQELTPGYIYRVTAAKEVGGPALLKHTLVTNVMQNEGYSILMDGMDDWKRTFWLMGREGFDLSYLR
jgi:hypothetical protein